MDGGRDTTGRGMAWKTDTSVPINEGPVQAVQATVLSWSNAAFSLLNLACHFLNK